jgi:uncharacterized protein YbjT (DUF2867 family)
MTRILAVCGATGQQGGGLVRAALADPAHPFAVRALTRDPDGPRARALAELGAEVVRADLDDPASLERAFAGADAAFCVTNYWEHFSTDRERAQAANLAAAAAATGVGHVVWSTLEDTRTFLPADGARMPALGGYNVPHLDAKGEADAEFTRRGLPLTRLRTSFYWDNLIHFGMGPQRLCDGRLAFTLPMGDAALPGIAAEDIGACAYAIVVGGARFVGETVSIAGEHLTGAEMAAALSDALGEEVVHNAVSPAAYRAAGFPGADDLGNMFQVKAEFEAAWRAPRDVAATRALHPGLRSFAGWLAERGAEIPVAVAA